MIGIEIGREYTFDTSGTDSTWKAYDGKKCTVIRPLTQEEADIDDVGPMWRIRFNDRRKCETEAFDDELYGPYQPKLILMNGNDAEAMIVDLRSSGQLTVSGDRRSQLFNFATIVGRSAFVGIYLVEHVFASEERSCYVLTCVDDIDNVGWCCSTEHLDKDELVKLLDDLAYDLYHGRR